MERNTEREIAYHEAGHAFALHALGFDVQCVTIVPVPGTYNGLCTPSSAVVIPPSRHCVVSLAGYAAFKLVRPTPDETDDKKHKEADSICALIDAQAALFHVLQSVMGSEAFTGQARDVLYAWMHDPAHLYFLYCEHEAERLVGKGRDAVEKLAEALMETKTLTGMRVREIIEAAMPGAERLPTKLTQKEQGQLLGITQAAIGELLSKEGKP